LSPGQSPSNFYYQQNNFELATNQQAYSNDNNDASFTFTFDEIGAIINGKDFDPLNEEKDANQSGPHGGERNSNQNLFVENNNQIASIKYETNNLDSNCFSENDYRYGTHGVEQQMNNCQVEQAKPLFYQGQSILNTRGTAQTDPMMANRTNLSNKSYFVNNLETKSKPYVEIVEQPAKCALRFRYKCEGRSAGSLPGINSTTDNKTFPAIRIANYIGRAVVVISCVTKDPPYKSHPHNIVGKEGCKKGICTIVVQNEANTVRNFPSLGIQCVKRKDIEESLTLRESINVDPFRNGFAHKSCASNIDLNVVRLCFQVFIEGQTSNKCDVPLTPVVSDPIHDKKAMSDLVITKLSHHSAPATGGREVILLCDRISKDDIQIRFYEERDEKLIWETYSDISPTDVHKQVAICFKTPKYFNENITQPVMVRIQLKRVSDNQVSEPRLFQFLPCESDEDIISRKRQKIEFISTNHYALDNILHNHQHRFVGSQQQSQAGQPVHASDNLIHQIQHGQTGPTNSHPQQSQQQQQVQNRLLEPSPSPAQARQLSPSPTRCRRESQHSGGRPATNNLAPSPSSNTQEQQAIFMIDSQNIVVRREIIDNEGKVMQLVDRPTNRDQAQEANRLPPSKPLGSSLDRIDTSELMRDVNFISNMDLNLGSNLSIHLNGPDIMQMDNQNHPRTSMRVSEMSCRPPSTTISPTGGIGDASSGGKHC